MSNTIRNENILRFIDFNLLFRGHISLAEVETEFSIESNFVADVFEQYRVQNENNVQFEPTSHRYFQSSQFHPLYDYPPREFIAEIKSYFNKVLASSDSAPMHSETILNFPDTLVMARLVQAILNGNPVNVIYTSLTSGSAARDIVPHSIVDNGLRWHLRGYDRKSKQFRDFILTRISKVTVKAESIFSHELRDHDEQWLKAVELVIKPHPKNIGQPTAIEMDYGMINGELKISTRAALAGYLLRRWNVDCTETAHLDGAEYQLWLSNCKQLVSIPSLSIAPGVGG